MEGDLWLMCDSSCWGKFLDARVSLGFKDQAAPFTSLQRKRKWPMAFLTKWPPGNRKYDATSWVCKVSLHLKAKECQGPTEFTH